MNTQLKNVLRPIYRRYWDRPALLAPYAAARYRRRFGRWPNLFPPRTFNEKLLFRRLFDRRPILPRLTGKLEVRDYIEERLGHPDGPPRLLAVVRDPAEFDHLDLPPTYIMKGSHASGLLRIVTPETPLEPGEGTALAAKWIGYDHARERLEWCYKDIARVVVIEELLRSPDGGIPADYKFFCFDGRVHFAQIDSARFEGHTQSLFDRDWNHLPARVSDYEPDPEPPPAPALLAEMIDIAERLSAGMDFMRVDLYALPGQVRVGELTMYPQGGNGYFTPPEWDGIFGQRWRLPPFSKLRASAA